MESSKSWTVVHFESDQSVQAVPTNWINGNMCLWPSLPKDKISGALRNCDFNSCWPSHPVRIFRNATFDDYIVARSKATVAEQLSDLNSEVENEGKRKRKIIKRKLSSSSDSEVEQHGGKPNESLPSPPIWPDNNESSGEYLNHDSDLNNEVSSKVDTPIPTPADGTPRIPKKKLKTPVEKVSEDMANGRTPTSVDGTRRILLKKLKTPVERVSEDMASGKSSHSCCVAPQVLYNIQSLLVELSAKVTHQHANGDKSNNILQRSNIEFPIKNEETLNEMEGFLTNNENYSLMVAFFSNLGGSNSYEFIKRCLAPLIDDTIVEKFSFNGRKGKKQFSPLVLCKAVIDAAQKANFGNKKDIELKVGVFLRKAKERLERKKK